MKCILCDQPTLCPFRERKFRWGGRRWLLCTTCDVVLVHPDDRVPEAEEREEYELHQNDAHYRRYLGDFFTPLVQYLKKGMTVLDYGCGPHPELSEMFDEAGFQVARYDPFFHGDQSLLAKKYDAVTATEVIEHFREPAQNFDQMVRMLRAGGILAITTGIRGDSEFLDWHYIREKSHVTFYSEACLTWLEQRFNLDVLERGANRRIWRVRGETR